MSALEAARLGDQIGHSSAWAGLLIGALAGVALAIAVILIVGTGGVAAVFIGAGIAAAGAGGALAGAHIGELIPSSPKGPIATGSPNTFVGFARRNVARAGLDIVACANNGAKLIAQGSSTVYVNQKMFARRSDKIVCSAVIRDGCTSVLVGGETATVPGLTIEEEIPPWVKTTLTLIMWGGAIIATVGAVAVVGWGAAIGGFVGSVAGSMGLGWVGGQIGQEIGGELGARIGEVIGGVLGGFGGGWGGARLGGALLPKGPIPVEPTPPAKTPPAETPPPETPPAKTPPAKTPPVETPPAETPSALDEARVARDTHASELGPQQPPARPAAVTGGYNTETGQVATGRSGGGLCAEDRVVEALGGDSNKVQFTEAVRPRRGGPPFQEVPVCPRCQTKYNSSQFPPGTKFAPKPGE